MNKKLLLLGILLSHDMHGYELSEILKFIGIPIEMKKSNAYRLLGVLEEDELITFTNEQVGNRPVRRVYSITEKGKEEFQRLLRENLAAYTEPDFPSLIGIDFIHLLPAEEAVPKQLRCLKNV
jgi:DNA-binding PadR family transcriptional regulator